MAKGALNQNRNTRGSTSTRKNALFAAVFCLWAAGTMDLMRTVNVRHILASSTALSSFATPLTSSDTGRSIRQHPPLSCADTLTQRNEQTIYDPNDGMPESPKKQTITNPPFWISLHKQQFDPMRWASIMNRGEYYETGLTKQFQQILANTTTPGLVLDIGMNIGWFTLWSRAHGHQVAGFEPNPVMYLRMCESLQLNGWTDTEVKIFPYALGQQEETLNLTTGRNPGGSSFYPEKLAKKFRRTLPVPVVTLDSVARQEGWLQSSTRIYLMKVDVEAFEYYVFQGGRALLESGRVENIIMENSNTDLQLVTNLMVMIARAGYRVHLLSDANGEPVHPEMMPGIEEELRAAKPDMNVDEIGDSLKYLAKVNCNMWWVKK